MSSDSFLQYSHRSCQPAHFRLLLYLAATQNILVHYCRGSVLNYVQRICRQVHTSVQTHRNNASHSHTQNILLFLFSLAPFSSFSPSTKMRSLRSWRLLLLTEQMGQSRQLVYHTATAEQDAHMPMCHMQCNI